MLFKKYRKWRLKQYCLRINRAYRNANPINSNNDTLLNVDNVPGTVIKKVAYYEVQPFLDRTLPVPDEVFSSFTMREKRVVAIFIRKLQDRAVNYLHHYEDMGYTEEQMESCAYDNAYVSKAYSRKAANRLFYYAYYKASEGKKGYERWLDT